MQSALKNIVKKYYTNQNILDIYLIKVDGITMDTVSIQQGKSAYSHLDGLFKCEFDNLLWHSDYSLTFKERSLIFIDLLKDLEKDGFLTLEKIN